MELAFTAGRATRRRVAVPAAGPFWHLAGMFPETADIFLLDSALNEGGLGRWSYAGGEPLASLTGRRRAKPGDGLDLEVTVWREPDGTPACPPRRLCGTGDPVAALRALRNAYADAQADGATEGAAPFAGGLVGWFGYGVAWAGENLPPEAGPIGSEAPDLLFMVVDDVLCHDHATDVTTLVVTGRGVDDRAAASDLESRLADWRARLAAASTLPPGRPLPAAQPAPDCSTAPDLSGITAACDEPAYLTAVSRCREHILCGDAFEICLTQQLSTPLRATPWELYAALRAVNPAPFAAFLRAGGVTVAGASPERFLSATAGGVLESRPIKGTRPRGATPADDARLRRDLAEAEKDRAENLMIVDLVRSDLGRVARIGSVTVPDLCVVETYATVHQMVSTVRAELKPGCDALDAVRACFPGGSMTGAPKLEAMAIIAGLEPMPRGVYSGALGWLGWDGAMDLSIVIRTFVCANGRATFGVGGAVTADSDPAAEYRESLDKARALLAALRLAVGGEMDNAPTTEGNQP
jgi:para-aminobenzoate synthetase component 1